MGLCFLGTRCEKELLVCRKCCALQSLQKKEKMQSAPTCGLQDCTDDCDLLSSGGSLLSTALTQTEMKSHSFHLKGSPLSAASQRDQRSHCLQGWWGFKDSKETNEKLIWEAPATWGLFSCLTSAVMGELAMPNVLSAQIAWLHLFESCYLLPLISKVPAMPAAPALPPWLLKTALWSAAKEPGNTWHLKEKNEKCIAQCAAPEAARAARLTTTKSYWKAQGEDPYDVFCVLLGFILLEIMGEQAGMEYVCLGGNGNWFGRKLRPTTAAYADS